MWHFDEKSDAVLKVDNIEFGEDGSKITGRKQNADYLEGVG